MHPLVKLARQAIQEYIRHGRIITPPQVLTQEMAQRAGTFVSLKKGGQLRGCIGTFMPTKTNVAEEIIRNAIAAATEDPRFPPVREEELDELEVSVDVLSPPEPVQDLSQLDPKQYGVIVVKGPRKGLLLPDLEGVDTVEEQLRIAKMKAGILPEEDCEVYRFKVRRYH